MRLPDRYWWGRAILACAAAVGGIWEPVQFLSNTLPLEEDLGEPITNYLLLAAAFFILLQAIAVGLAVSAVRARDRFLRRRAALNGEMNAIPLASTPPTTGAIPDVAVEPLVLSWRATKGTRFAKGPLLILLGLGPAIELLLFLAFAGWSVITQGKPVRDLGTTSLALLTVVAAGGVLAALVIAFAHYLPTYFGRRYGATAMADGIEGRPQFGRRRFLLRWEEMRLFEVDGSGFSSFDRRRYRVYGERAIAEWENDPAHHSDFAPDGMTSEEMELRLAALVDVIRARAGLAPRTLSRALRAEESARLERERAFGYAAVLGAIGLVTVGLGVAVFALPLTSSAILNLVIAGSLGMFAVYLFVAGLRKAQGAWRLRQEEYVAHMAEAASSVPPPEAPDALHGRAVGSVALPHMVDGVLGIFLCANLIPVLLVWSPEIVHNFAPLNFPTPLGPDLAFVLTLYGLMGIVFLLLAVSPGA